MVISIANNGHVRLIGTLLATLLIATACQPGAPPGPKASGGPASASPSPTAAAKHVFMVVLENTSYQQALAQPYIASLAQKYSVATNYHAVATPSLPNYLA